MEARGVRARADDDAPGPAAGREDHEASRLTAVDRLPLADVLVLVDRPDSGQARDDEHALVAAGAHVRGLGDPEVERPQVDAAQLVVVLLDSSASALERPSLAGLQGTLGDAFCIVVGVDLTSASRARLLLAGADDCLAAPYLPEELVARTASLVRRRPPPPREVLVSAGLVLGVPRPVRGRARLDLSSASNVAAAGQTARPDRGAADSPRPASAALTPVIPGAATRSSRCLPPDPPALPARPAQAGPRDAR